MRNVMTWEGVVAWLRRHPQPACVRIEIWQVEHPTNAGMTRSMGLPVGQLADWRMPHPHCGGLHVREYRGYYTVHLDRVNPRCDLPGHLAVDAPLIGSGAALGALIGIALGESPGSMLVGALIGGAIGTALASTQETSECVSSARKAAR